MSDTEVKAIQRRRGTTAEYRTFTSGLQGEVTVNITNYTPVISDGLGHNFETARADMSNVNQINVLQKGIMDNSLSNFPVDYIYNAENGTYTIRAKDTSTIISQLSNAYIADIELRNVTMNSLVSKGIARDDLKNVTFSKVSWDSGETNRLGGAEAEDISGGGLVFRNLSNVFVETFNEFPSSSGAVGGLAYKDLSNARNVTTETLNSIGDSTSEGIAARNLSNVTNDTLYGKNDATSTSSPADKGKFVLQRDLSNVVSVSTSFLTKAGILANNLSNIDFENVDNQDLITLGVALDDMSNVSRNVFINTSDTGLFKLMTYDGSNADKEKVFKGNKNFLNNTKFDLKYYKFDESSDPFDNEQTFNDWIARSPLNGLSATNHIEQNGNGVVFKGIFTQSMTKVGKEFIGHKVYFSCSADSTATLIKVGLILNEHYDQGIAPIDGVLSLQSLVFSSLSDLEYDSVYNRYYAEFDFTNENIEQNLLNMLRESQTVSLIIAADESAELYYPQLELNNVTNWENRPFEIENALTNYNDHKVVELVSFAETLPFPTEEYYQLTSSFSSDPVRPYYVLTSDCSSEELDEINNRYYLPSGRRVYFVSNDQVEYYTISTYGQFEITSMEVSSILSKFKLGDLAYNINSNRIYTLLGYKDDLSSYSWLVSQDPRPYDNTLYYSRTETGSWRMFSLNKALGTLEEISISGGGGSAALPIFFHVQSDKRMNNASWVCGDNFSKLYASIYSGAYEYLMNQVYPTGTFIPGGNEPLSSEFVNNDHAHWLITWSDNDVETTTVSLQTGTVTDILNYCNTKGYTVIQSSSDIKQIQIKKDLTSTSEVIGSTTVNFYRTFDGLKVIVDTSGTEDGSELLKSLYNNYGYAWYYLLCPNKDLKTAYFKLPRAKGIEVMGDVHPSYVSTSAGDKYNKKFSEGSTGSVATYMSTYFYVGTTVLPREEIELGKTLEVLNSLESKSIGLAKPVDEYIYDDKYTVTATVEEDTCTLELPSLVVNGEDEYEYEIEPDESNPNGLTVTFKFNDIAAGSTQTLTNGTTYNITEYLEGGVELQTTLTVTGISDSETDTIMLSNEKPVVLIASAKNLTMTLDFDFNISTSSLRFITFDLIIDKRSPYSGSLSITNCTLPALTNGQINYLKVRSYVDDYNTVPYVYKFSASL